MAVAETLRITRDIDDKVNDVNKRLVGFDHKVGSVIEGERIGRHPNLSSAFYLVRRQGDWSSHSKSGQSNRRDKQFVTF